MKLLKIEEKDKKVYAPHLESAKRHSTFADEIWSAEREPGFGASTIGRWTR